MAAVCAKCRIIGAQENGDGDLCLKGAPGTFLAARGCRILHIWEGESVGMEHREKGRVPWNSEAMTCKCKMWWISGWAEALSTRLHSVWFLESTQDWDDRFGYKNCILSSLHFRNRVEKSPQTSIFGKCATVKTPGEVWLIQEKTKRFNCFSVIVEVIWGKNINAGNIFSEFLRFKIIFIVWFIGWILLYDGYDGFILMDKLRGLQIPPREIDDREKNLLSVQSWAKSRGWRQAKWSRQSCGAQKFIPEQWGLGRKEQRNSNVLWKEFAAQRRCYMAESQRVQQFKNQNPRLFWCLERTFIDVNLLSQILTWDFENKGEWTLIVFPGLILMIFPDLHTQQQHTADPESIHIFIPALGRLDSINCSFSFSKISNIFQSYRHR